MTKTIRWWQRGVIYQIYPRSFQDSSGNGTGDLRGIIQRLDYLKALGLRAIWLSPFYRSPMADFGYDVADYCNVDPLFGTLDDFDELVREAHARDMRLIIDYVPNHSSDEHPWFVESRSSRDNPKRDWYIWRDAKPDGSPPNNWGSMFGGPAWTFDETTGQYYFHQFHPKQPDLNWRNPAVREAMHDVLRFWLERGVDGFRMDVVYIIWKHPDMPDQPLIEGAAGRGPDDIFGRQEQIYAFNYSGVHERMRELRAVLDEYGDDKLMVGEIWLPLSERMTYHGEIDDEFHLPFNFDLLLAANADTWQADRFRDLVADYEAAVPAHGFPNYVLGSHDVARLASRLKSQSRARVAAMMLLTLRGTPTIYMGEELGMVNGDIQPDQVQDPQGLILGVEHTRDICRTPMQWDDSTYAGFSTVTPWLPVNDDYATRNVAHQATDELSMLTLYKRLLSLRAGSDALTIGSYTALDSPDGTFVYQRQHNDETYLIALNFTAQAKTITLPGPGTIRLSTFLNRTEATVNALTLQGDEGILLSLSPE